MSLAKKLLEEGKGILRLAPTWVSRSFCRPAKRLTVYPGQTAVIKDAAAYGFILIQGRGKFGDWDIETPTLIRYGELTNDEFFVTEKAAKEGVTIVNTSKTEPIVMLKHFAENPELEI